jgi:hypothetical protein
MKLIMIYLKMLDKILKKRIIGDLKLLKHLMNMDYILFREVLLIKSLLKLKQFLINHIMVILGILDAVYA